jgi:hypothetical protein
MRDEENSDEGKNDKKLLRAKYDGLANSKNTALVHASTSSARTVFQ